MLKVARRVAGLVVAVALVAGLPLAAARASCVCDHGHQHETAPAAPHECTSACTPATCPTHRQAAADGHADHDAHAAVAPHDEHDRPLRASREGVTCSCAGDAQALFGQATVAGVLPPVVCVDPPAVTGASVPSVAPSRLSLATAPPAPPPRA